LEPVVIIESPADGARQHVGVPFDTVCLQQLHDFEQGAATLQFSNEPEGPWTTCRPSEGSLRAPIIPWSSQGESFTISDCVQVEAVWVRVGLWVGQNGQSGELDGPPTYFSSEPTHWPKPFDHKGEEL